MAAKFGKREKIIVGIVIGLVAIFAIHIFIFKDPADQTRALTMTRDQLRGTVQRLKNVLSPADLQKYKQETTVSEKILWKSFYDTDLFMPPPFNIDPEPTPIVYFEPQVNPGVPAVSILVDQVTIDAYNVVKAQFDKEYEVALPQIKDLLVGQFRRISEMKKTFESGGAWPGDSSSTPSTIKLSFLESKPLLLPTDFAVGWNMPMKLLPTLEDPAALQDELEQLRVLWGVLEGSRGTPSETLANLDYQDQLTKMGMDITTIAMLQNNYIFARYGSIALGEFQKILLARLIWDKKPKDDIWFVGSKQLTRDHLEEILNVLLPEGYLGILDLYTLYHQLNMLDDLILTAREQAVEDIELVIFSSIHSNYYYNTEIIKQDKEAVDPAATPAPPKVRVGAVDTPLPRGAIPPPRPPSYPGRPVATPMSKFLLDPVVFVVGYAAVVDISYTATNESSMRFLYEVVRDPRYYKIEGLTIQTSEKDSSKVKVWLSVSKPFLIDNVSKKNTDPLDLSPPLVDPVTQKPNPIIQEGGTHEEAEKRARQRYLDVGIDRAEILRQIREDHGVFTTATATTSGALAPTTSTLPLAPVPTPAP